MKIFLSAVSAQFKDCRNALASDLRAVGAEVVVQEDFTQHGGTLLEKLEAYISQADRVIALVGDAFGWEPEESARPAGGRASYSQWEVRFALGERLEGITQPAKPLFLYFPSADYLATHPVPESPEVVGLQADFVKVLRASGKDWNPFSSLDQLRALVLRDGFRLPPNQTRPSNLPYASIGDLFKGREVFLQDLHTRFQAAQGLARVVHGLGGVGKTRLAIEYAWRFQADYRALLVVGAESPEALRRNLAALCAPDILNLPQQVAKEEDQRLAAALQWLAENPGWLLIADNVDTEAAAEALAKILPRLGDGHVLATSRLSDWSAAFDPLELTELEPEAAVAFLLQRTAGHRLTTDDDGVAARELAVEQLEGLALPLEQAGAYISRMRISIADYLARWRAGETKLRLWHDARLMNYPRNVLVTWDTSFEQLDAPARALMNLLCWCASPPMPRAVLETDMAEQVLALGVRHLENAPSPAAPEEALATLADFSLLKWQDAGRSFSIHRLVREVARDRLPEADRPEWLKGALALFDAYLPADPPADDVRSWPLWLPVQAHVQALIGAAEVAGIPKPTSRLMNDLGTLFHAKCLWAEAESLMHRVLAIDEKSYGPEHPTVAVRLNNLAALFLATNRLKEAEPLMHRVLEIDEKHYGPDRPEVAVDLNNLAQLLQATNRLKEAESLTRRALEIDEKSYGPDHPRVAIRLSNLASLLKASHRLEEAEPLMRRALEIDGKSYGPDHPKFASALGNLARLLQDTHRQEEAEPLMRQALKIDEKSYGPEHPQVARDLNNLATLLEGTQRPAEAELPMRRALEIDEKSYGPNHPDVARDLNNLAELLQDTQRLPEAEPLMARALAIFEASLGPEHQNTGIVRKNLAALRRKIVKEAS
jgi:tetratricopeptide (TPR) repeat protein